MFNLSDQFRGELFASKFSLQLQLDAIRELLRRNVEAEEKYSDHIKDLDTLAQKPPGDDSAQRLDDVLTDAVQAGIYHDAASSMAAVGMLAPFVESLFAEILNEVGRAGPHTLDGRRATVL